MNNLLREHRAVYGGKSFLFALPVGLAFALCLCGSGLAVFVNIVLLGEIIVHFLVGDAEIVDIAVLTVIFIGDLVKSLGCGEHGCR